MMAETIRVGVNDVVRHFEGLEDPRSQTNRRHPLVSVIVISLMAVLAGAGGPTAIARWALLKEDLLLKLLRLPNGIPKKDVYQPVEKGRAKLLLSRKRPCSSKKTARQEPRPPMK